MSARLSLLPERIQALLTPDGLRLHRQGGSEVLAVGAEPQAAPWRAPLAALDGALRERPPRRVLGAARLPAGLAARLAPRLDVVLSEHFTRWQLLPWQPEVESPAEQEAYARHRFREVYGELARQWQVRCAGQAPGPATPACAIDGDLLAALRAVAAANDCRLGSLRPLFAAAVDRWRRKLPRGVAWFAVLESDQLSLGLLRERRWRALHRESLAATDNAGLVLAGLLARSALSNGMAADSGRLLLCGEGADGCVLPLPAPATEYLGGALAWDPPLRKSA